MDAAPDPTRPARDRRLHLAHQVLVGALWTATGAVLLAWAGGWPLPIRAEPEPLAGLLGMTSTAVTWLYGLAARRFEQHRRALARTRAELAEERYSLAHALAYGYVHNFLEPALTRLLQRAGARAAALRFYVYLPEDLAELEPDATERTLARLRGLGFTTGAVQLDLNPTRPREVLTLWRTEGDPPRFFDFPTTLLTLRQLVDYRLETRPNQFPDQTRRELGQTYIAEFRSALERHLRDKDLTGHVVLVDRSLAPLGQAN